MNKPIIIQTRTKKIYTSLSRFKDIPFFSSYSNFNDLSNTNISNDTIFIDEDYDTLLTIINLSCDADYPIKKDKIEYIIRKCDYYGIQLDGLNGRKEKQIFDKRIFISDSSYVQYQYQYDPKSSYSEDIFIGHYSKKIKGLGKIKNIKIVLRKKDPSYTSQPRIHIKLETNEDILFDVIIDCDTITNSEAIYSFCCGKFNKYTDKYDKLRLMCEILYHKNEHENFRFFNATYTIIKKIPIDM